LLRAYPRRLKQNLEDLRASSADIALSAQAFTLTVRTRDRAARSSDTRNVIQENRDMQPHATIIEASFIRDADLKSAKGPRRRPIHGTLALFSVAYFVGALATDFVYWQMPDVLWERFSIWLIAAGLVVAGLATIAYAIELVVGERIDRPAWPRVVGYALAVLLALTNAFVHSRDGYTAVVPTGLMLSALVVVVLVLTAVAARILTNRRRFGV
jgi:uncharacterized membrane protein